MMTGGLSPTETGAPALGAEDPTLAAQTPGGLPPGVEESTQRATEPSEVRPACPP